MESNEQPLYRPRQLFNTSLKKQYHDTAASFYESLAEQSSLDKAGNAVHVKAYNAAKAEADVARKKLSSVKAGKGWTIFGIVFGFVVGVVCLIIGIANPSMWYFYLAAVAGFALGIGMIVFLKTGIKRKMAAAKALVEAKEAVEKKCLDACYADMAGLNDLLDDGMPGQVMEKATPIIDLDKTFTPERLDYMMKAFGMSEETDPDTSVLGVISGNIQGNPFILEKVFRHEVRDKVYEGTLTISWTTTSTDSKGNTTTHHHTQVLHAEAIHPAPAYWDETRLIYGSEAAPHLHFSRRPSGMSGKSEKDAAKFVKARTAELDKKEQEAIKKGKTFTKLGNDEFDAYFGADDRDNEVEYRLLFTPLAQRNMLELLKDPEPYGDDFVMVKDAKLTSVCSRHSQAFEYMASAEYFKHYDFQAGKQKFVDYCDKFIQGLFFDLAPILSIPLYQIHKPHDYIYGNDYRSHMTSYEHEAMINKMSRHLFMPDGADPSLPLILKEANAHKISGTDEVAVLSRSYKTTPMMDYVPVMGGDGRMHSVPVPWTQYDEVRGNYNVGLVDSKSTRPAFEHKSLEPVKKYLADRGLYFERGMLSFFVGGEKARMKNEDADKLTDFFTSK